MHNFLSADDRFAILDVIHSYNLTADEKDVEGTIAHYVEEGQITGDMQTGKGKAAMREDLPSIFKAEVTLKRHLANNVRFFPTENSEEFRVTYVLLVMEGRAAPISVATSLVTDLFRRTDQGWKVVRHHIEVDPSARWLVKFGEKVVNVVENIQEKLS